MNRLDWMKLSFTLPIFVLWGCSQESGTVEESAAPQTAQQAETEPAPSEGAVTLHLTQSIYSVSLAKIIRPKRFNHFWRIGMLRFPSCLIAELGPLDICLVIGHQTHSMAFGYFGGRMLMIEMRVGKIMLTQVLKRGLGQHTLI